MGIMSQFKATRQKSVDLDDFNHLALFPNNKIYAIYGNNRIIDFFIFSFLMNLIICMQKFFRQPPLVLMHG